MTKAVECFFDVGSPASYLAWTQLPALAERQQAQLIWKPMLLGGVFKATGNQSPVMIPAKGTYMLKDLTRYARHYDVEMQFNPFFPINTLQLMRGAVAAQDLGQLDAYLNVVFPALWVKGLDMGQAEVVAQVLTEAGLDAEQVFTHANTPEIKGALKASTEEAIARGAFGAPTLFVGDEMFFGQDRLDWVESALHEKA
ncbi:MAG TPA: disulfide bond formation protein DsbA [Spongiibacteraceae bacterium]|nr:disulfide bond formation protein DsbA [Spongiibacteraceae bacterium]HCS29687.1 disulfide bond formation protein DsbA [Spongiibacteraceae bacterium]